MALKGRAALVGMARALPALMRISKDAETMKRIAESGTDDMLSAFSVLIEKHADDLLIVLASIAGREPDEYSENATMSEQVRDMTAILNDSELMDFFVSARAVGLTGAARQSQSESTED